MDKGASALPTGPSQAEPEVSALRASVPSAWLRSMRMEWSTDAGVVSFNYPGDLGEQDILDLKCLMDIAFTGMVRRAQAIEARRAEPGTGSVHESAVAKPCAPPDHQP